MVILSSYLQLMADSSSFMSPLKSTPKKCKKKQKQQEKKNPQGTPVFQLLSCVIIIPDSPNLYSWVHGHGAYTLDSLFHIHLLQTHYISQCIVWKKGSSQWRKFTVKKRNLSIKHDLRNELRHINKITSSISKDDTRNRDTSKSFAQQLMNSGHLTNSNKVDVCPKMAGIQKIRFW